LAEPQTKPTDASIDDYLASRASAEQLTNCKAVMAVEPFRAGAIMKTMVVWRTVPGKYKPAVEQFLKTGGPLPAGVNRLGRWHVPGSILGWHLMDGDPAAIAEHVAEWADFLELEVYPVIEDDAAGAAAKKVYGK
jgi:hypothetical protein